ncbi:tRNA lysidine(34) synthetase TilS [Lysobacter sp. CFH 32150]|uniref:tRNA lysidine(34) synthetase TilS n=1 Tax=Lysobacter sp. CFH 32150 TaxID=2927128 RepID=UPI001FA765D0|nr:tRNA lysidine(34) synthetase TilS [Lysobacter sp. CFH 32150]MCI4566853.1 tRNA lysidine(34) synthetase TilS [Lysobacter sp. CFH 32150]
MAALASNHVDLTPPTGGGVLVGLSGGLDSIALLHVLAASHEIRARGLRAIHVHHGLHRDADAWTMHCQRVCDELAVPLAIVRIEVERDSGEGLEAAARKVRHAAFEAELREEEVLALAHHRDDQAETFLLRALRASGPDGLGAMRAWRRFGRGWLWRPLLGVPRSELLAYAQQHALHWIDDPSNADTDLDRNFLRHRVMPLLRERWPGAEAAFAQSATLSAETSELLAEGDALALASARTLDAHTLARDTLRALPPARRGRVLRLWIATLGLPPLPAEGVARIEAELLDARVDAEPEFAWHGATVRLWRDLLHAGRQRRPLPSDWDAAWDGATPLRLPTGDTLALQGAAGFDAPLRVHARQGGERITLPRRAHSHALKHVLQDFGVPPWVRERLPLLSNAAGAVMAAGDLVYSAEFDTWLHAHGARLAWSD